MTLRYINPPDLPDWSGLFSQVVTIELGSQRLILVSGQVGVAADQTLAGDGTFGAQFEAALRNLEMALTAASSNLTQVAKLTIYVVNYSADHAGIIADALARHLGERPRPALTLVGVQALARPVFLLEVDALAIGSSAGTA